MRIYSWNVNGIRAVWNKGKFQEFIKEHDPDILCLQETKAQQDQSEVDLPQYQEYWNSADKKGYSGTAIFTKTKPLKIINGFSDEINKYFDGPDKFGDPIKEGRVITAEYDKFFLVSVYTPNSKGDLGRLQLRHKQWDKAFLAHCKQLESTKPVIFCGDLNVAHTEIDLANPKPNIGKHGFTNEEREGFQNFIDAGFIDTYRHFHPNNTEAYTWWTHWANARTKNLGWRIDYFLVSEAIKDNLVSAEIYPDVMGSDHCPISIEIEL
jgi:exodeoxyribonuclease III